MTWAKIGMEVVCINPDARPGRHWSDDAPVKGRVYTIAKVWIARTGNVNLEFEELSRNSGAHIRFGRYVGYAAHRFRPLVTKTESDDVAMFKRIADQVPNMEDVG